MARAVVQFVKAVLGLVFFSTICSTHGSFSHIHFSSLQIFSYHNVTLQLDSLLLPCHIFARHVSLKPLFMRSLSKGTSICFISQMCGKLKFRKSVNAVICQIAAFTLFPNLSFPNISEMKQKDVP